MFFAQRLRVLRKEKDLSQADLGKLFGLTKQSISNYENGGTVAPAETLRKMAEFFDVPLDFLLGIGYWEIIEDSQEALQELRNKQIESEILEPNQEEADALMKELNNDPNYQSYLRQQIDEEKQFWERHRRLRSLYLGEESPSPQKAKIPILGAIRAGVPLMVQESYGGYLEVPEYIRADFALQVTGDSMVGAGILDGDYVVCREATDAQSGQIVVALNDLSTGFSEATLKYYINNSNAPVLRPANPRYSEINMKDGYRIGGVAVGLMRKDMPPMHVYQNYLTVAGHEDWTEVIELAAGQGIKPERMKHFIKMITEMGKGG